MSHTVYAAVDIGGTKIAAALVDSTGDVLTRAESPTPARGSAEVLMGTVAELIEKLSADPRWGAVTGLGIASAGPVDPTNGTVSPVNIPAWREFPLVEHVRRLAPVADGEVRKVLLLGDGAAMAAGEHWRGSARGYDDALCLVVSTGVGAGLILDGALRAGPSGNAGHLGHISVDVAGEDCACGSRGCLETIASGTAIAKWAVRNGWNTSDDDSDSMVAPSPVSAADIAASALRGNEIALAAFERAGRALAAGIASAAMLADIRVAVIGGGVAKAGRLLMDPVVRHLPRYASLPFTRSIAVLPATLGADAGLVGAAAALAAAAPGERGSVTTTLEVRAPVADRGSVAGLPLAFSTLGCPDAAAEEVAALARAFGASGVELRCDRSEGPFALDKPADARREAVRILRAAGVSRFWVASYLRVADPSRTDAQFEADVEEVLAVAADVGAIAVRVFAGAPVPGAEADALAARRLTVAADKAQDRGVRVLLETHDSHPRGVDVARVLRLAGHPATGAIWDVLHTWRGGETPAQTVLALGSGLEHVQLKDVASVEDTTPVHLGTGSVPLGDVVDELARAHYRGWLSLEWELRWYPEVAPLSDALACTAAWLAWHESAKDPRRDTVRQNGR